MTKGCLERVQRPRRAVTRVNGEQAPRNPVMQNPTSPSHGEGYQRSGSKRLLASPATTRQPAQGVRSGRSVCTSARNVRAFKE